MTTNTDEKRITDTYRELANQRVPEALDDRILAMAREEVRTRRGLTPAWIRPAAWAATIGLSLAFLLEMSQLDEAPPPLSPAPAVEAGAADSPRRAERQDLEEADSAEEMTLLREATDDARAGSADIRTVKILAPEPAAAAISLEKKEHAGPSCDETARSTADGWYECVLRLREIGLATEAAGEFAALLEAFPEFHEPLAQ